MSDVAIEVENLSKRYRIGRAQSRNDTLRDAIADAFKHANPRRWLRRQNHNPDIDQDYIWALKEVSFQVKYGEVVGIIGRNGAGKSTLLKILSRITEPTSGRAVVRGRVGSLLEVGTGFHPELTGRENIYLNGAILGMKRTEIEHKFDEIVAFSEIEKFLDTPVKRYSSGMYVRLAFAVAAHLEPEILLVDEVLAVGDVAFQKKCLGKMGDVAKEGRTVLFVSHNMGAIRSMCSKCILLFEGKIEDIGFAEQVINQYLSKVNKDFSDSSELDWNVNDAPGSRGFYLRKIELNSSNGEKKSIFVPQEPIDINIHYQLLNNISGFRIVMQLITSTGEIAFTSTDHYLRQDNYYQKGLYKSICRIPSGLLNIGDYWVRIGAGIPGIEYLLEPREFIKLSMTGIGNHGSIYSDYQNWPGVVCPKLEWNIVKID